MHQETERGGETGEDTSHNAILFNKQPQSRECKVYFRFYELWIICFSSAPAYLLNILLKCKFEKLIYKKLNAHFEKKKVTNI